MSRTGAVPVEEPRKLLLRQPGDLPHDLRDLGCLCWVLHAGKEFSLVHRIIQRIRLRISREGQHELFQVCDPLRYLSVKGSALCPPEDGVLGVLFPCIRIEEAKCLLITEERLPVGCIASKDRGRPESVQELLPRDVAQL